MNLLLGVLFVGKACLDIPFPGSRPHSVWMAADFAALRIFHFQNRYKNIKSNKHKSSLFTCTERIFLYKKRRYLKSTACFRLRSRLCRHPISR